MAKQRKKEECEALWIKNSFSKFFYKLYDLLDLSTNRDAKNPYDIDFCSRSEMGKAVRAIRDYLKKYFGKATFEQYFHVTVYYFITSVDVACSLHANLGRIGKLQKCQRSTDLFVGLGMCNMLAFTTWVSPLESKHNGCLKVASVYQAPEEVDFVLTKAVPNCSPISAILGHKEVDT